MWIRRTVAAALAAAAVLALPWTPRAEEPQYFALPIVLKLEGIEPIYGVAAGVNGLTGDRFNVYAVKGFGGADAQGIVTTDIPVGGKALGLNAFAVQVNQLDFKTSYTRALAGDSPIRQRVAGYGVGATLDAYFAARALKLTGGLAFSAIQLKAFFNDSGDEIPLPGANLADIKTRSTILGVAWDKTDGAVSPRAGYRLQAGGVTAEGRSGQSDTLTATYQGTGYVPLGDRLTWVVHGMVSDASILRKQTQYDTPSQVDAALRIDCSGLANARQQADCTRLKSQLIDYITANNNVGTATPLGGSIYLRGFRELRYRAAHTRLFASELRWRLGGIGSDPKTGGARLAFELAPFWEVGSASDAADGAGGSVQSYGAALRAVYRKVPVRLEAAQGEGQSGTVVLFTLGYPW